MKRKKFTSKVDLNRIISLIFKNRDNSFIKVCIHEKQPETRGDVTYISPQAPLAKAILNRLEGEEIEFNVGENKQQVIILGVS